MGEMSASRFQDYGPDEHRAVEGIAALLDLNPPNPGEDDESVAWCMADWALLQGPAVRWDAMLYCARAMIDAQHEGMRYVQMAEVGLEALYEYNRLYGAGAGE
jgi:hypothetical protein